MKQDPLKLPEVCQRLRISYSTALRMMQSGELRSFRVRGSWRVWEKDLEAYIARQTRGGEEEVPERGEHQGS